MFANCLKLWENFRLTYSCPQILFYSSFYFFTKTNENVCSGPFVILSNHCLFSLLLVTQPFFNLAKSLRLFLVVLSHSQEWGFISRKVYLCVFCVSYSCWLSASYFPNWILVSGILVGYNFGLLQTGYHFIVHLLYGMNTLWCS